MLLFSVVQIILTNIAQWRFDYHHFNFKNQSSNCNIFICGILPHNESFTSYRLIINEVNNLLKFKCLVNNFHFWNQNTGWTLNNGAPDFLLFYSDGLNLVEKGNAKLGKYILKATDSNSKANPYKNSVSFNLNECESPPLTRSKPLYSPVKYVGSIRKPIRRLFKSFAQSYELFQSTVLPACLYPSQCLTIHCINLLLPMYLASILLELQLQPFPLTYQTFAILMLWYNLFLQSLKQGSDRNFKVNFHEFSRFSREFKTNLPEIFLK